MKKNLLVLIAFFAIDMSIFAQIPTYMEVDIPGTRDVLTIDGYPDEDLWFEVDQNQLTFSLLNATKPPLTDIDAFVQMAWSDVGLMFYVEITDDEDHFVEPGGTTYQRDNCEFFICLGKVGTWGPTIDTSLTGGSYLVAGDTLWSQIRIQLKEGGDTTTSDGRFKSSWALRAPLGSLDSGQMEAVAVNLSTGWALEVVMPWVMFNLPDTMPEEGGRKIGLDITVADADGTENKDNALSLLNNSVKDLEYDNKQYINTAILGALPVGVNHNLVSKDMYIYPTIIRNNVLNVKGVVNSLTIYNITGQVVLNVNQDNISKVNVSTLQPGLYIVNLNNNISQKIIVR